jgi:hypothetical protein
MAPVKSVETLQPPHPPGDALTRVVFAQPQPLGHLAREFFLTVKQNQGFTILVRDVAERLIDDLIFVLRDNGIPSSGDKYIKSTRAGPSPAINRDNACQFHASYYNIDRSRSPSLPT